MRKIYPLSEEVISKIAAGEVIERPMYAVKELVENSLDAGADSIVVHIEESGLRRITIIDNGEGMSEQDIRECFKPHTTSKISSDEELAHIRTHGFRGEALSSIAAISRMIIKSRIKDTAAGICVELREGETEKISPVGMPYGTQVIIENLFYPVPGRKKFLKSARTEFRHILELMTSVSLIYPAVHFTLTHNKKIVFDLPQTTDSLERIKILLGTTIFQNLLPVSYSDSYISVSGFLTKPQAAATTTQKQFISINKRKVNDKLVSLAVKEAYGTLLESSAYPACILFLTIPYELVDVNVHPRKESVRFVDTQLIYDAVFRAVSQALTQNNLTFYSETGNGLSLGDAPGKTNSFAARLLREKKLPWTIMPLIEISGNDVMQMHNLYLIKPTNHGMFVVDQHAAHERILYEQLLEEFKKQKNTQPIQRLSKAAVFDLSVTETELLQEYLPLFAQLGFTIEHFQKNTFLLQTVPLLFHDRDYQKLIGEILEELAQEKRVKEIDSVSRKMIAYLACRAAVKAGDKLTKKQAKDLLEKLETTPNNATCPHGRPIRVMIDINRIHRMFKRK